MALAAGRSPRHAPRVSTVPEIAAPSEAPSTPTVANRSWIVPFVVGAVTTLVLVAAVVGGFLLGGGGRQSAGADASASAAPATPLASEPAVVVVEPASVPVEVRGESLTAYDAEQTDSAIGEPLPTITGTTVKGQPLAIEGDGRPMALLVMAHWCPHCQAEVALLADHLRLTGLPDDVRLVAISTAYDATRGNYPASTWLRNAEWPVPTLVDDADSTALKALGIGAFPGLVLVDDAGDVLLRFTGGLNPTSFERALDIARCGAP